MKSGRKINYFGMPGPVVRGKPTLTREQRQARDRARVLKRIYFRRAWLSEYRLWKGCADCGYKEHAAALDFDHGDNPKSFSIMRDGLSRSRDSLIAEVKKCEVVCANCHRIRTQKQIKLTLLDEVR